MSTATVDDFLLRHAPAAPRPVEVGLLRARKSLRQALAELASVPDSALEKPWRWRDGEVDVRYGFYRQLEALEDGRARIRPLVARLEWSEPPARPIVGAATAARWDLHGLLAGLSDADLDRDPRNGEWTLRQTLAHIVSGQRAYGWFTAWWLARRDAPPDDFPPRVPEDAAAELPAEETGGVGTLADIGARLDQILDLSAGTLGGLHSDALAVRARWVGLPVDVRFRLVRWASHLREHTVQVEKTLGFVGHQTSEVERLLRLIAAAYGLLEEDLFMWPTGEPVVAEALAMSEALLRAIAESAATVGAAAQA